LSGRDRNGRWRDAECTDYGRRLRASIEDWDSSSLVSISLMVGESTQLVAIQHLLPSFGD
jgi:hypothetical protein